MKKLSCHQGDKNHRDITQSNPHQKSFGEGLYHSQFTQKSQGEGTPLSTLTTIMRKVCTTISPHSSHKEKLHHCQPSQQLKGLHLTSSSQQEEGPHPKGHHSKSKGGRTLRAQHSNSKRCRTLVTPQQNRRGCNLVTPHSKGESRVTYFTTAMERTDPPCTHSTQQIGGPHLPASS
jgi:hypothetical protein